MMEIREVMSGDDTPVYELLCELENKELNKALFLKGFAMQRKDRSMKAWVLTNDEEIIGYVSLRILYHLHHCANIAMIEELIVKKDKQRQGYGSTLFAQALAFAKQQSCIQLELSSKQSRKYAHHFYKQQGMDCDHLKFSVNIR